MNLPWEKKWWNCKQGHILSLDTCRIVQTEGRRSFWTVISVRKLKFDFLIQRVPHATEPGISLIILSLMRILQRNLKRTCLTVYEIWRHHNIRWKWSPFASRQDWTRRAVFWKVLASTYYVPKGLWPPRSPDLTQPDYFLWRYLKGRVYRNKPRTVDALKANIAEEIQTVTSDVLARTFQNMARWVQSCLDANGGHFQHMLWCRHISYTMR